MLVSLEYLQKQLSEEEYQRMLESIRVEYGWKQFPLVELEDATQLVGREIPQPEKRQMYEIINDMQHIPGDQRFAAKNYITRQQLLRTAERRSRFVFVEPCEVKFIVQRYVDDRETSGRPGEDFLSIPEIVEIHSLGQVRTDDLGVKRIVDYQEPGVKWLYQSYRRWDFTHKAENGRVFINKIKVAEKINNWKKRRLKKAV